MITEIQSEAKFLPISPRKVRPLAALVAGEPVSQALVILSHLPQKGAFLLKKVISTARADALNNYHLPEESLLIKQILVNEGPRLKRIDKSHSARFQRGIIQKRRAHIKVVLMAEEEEKKKDSAKKAPVLVTKKTTKK